ncbi:MAG TPA: PspC domain-containing protein, partial [Jiangellaceae bacterium]|nr:PspC domain-containing protein [Jiangellaceae bacterium]
MTTTQPASEQDVQRSAGAREAPRFARRSDGRLVGGVSTGLAVHLGVQPLSVRITFALLAALGGFGVVLYLALWVFTPLDQTV